MGNLLTSSWPCRSVHFSFLPSICTMGELHSTIVCHQERHAQHGILIDAAHQEDFLHLHISHSERQPLTHHKMAAEFHRPLCLENHFILNYSLSTPGVERHDSVRSNVLASRSRYRVLTSLTEVSSISGGKLVRLGLSTPPCLVKPAFPAD